MQITSITVQSRNSSRVNIAVDGKYRFSLDVFQLTDLGIKVGRMVSEDEITKFEDESDFGKTYTQALEYIILRPHSAQEIRDYLRRKMQATKYRSIRTGELKERSGISQQIADRIYDRLSEKGYVDDQKFTRWWIETRSQTKGISRRKLLAELRAKGIQSSLVEIEMEDSSRNDTDELAKVIAKKRQRYPDDQKFMAYLARQGFNYDAIKTALSNSSDD